jgi:UDP:flavonoid glycosyltransferase YjiC (YdhE family)
VARELARRGHEVAFACARAFCPEVERAGFRAFPAGRDWLATGLERAFPEVGAIPPGPERYAWARAHIFAGATARDAVPDLLALARTWPPDLVVRDAAEYGGCLAAELLAIPHAIVRTDSGSSSFAARDVVAGSLAAAREQFGLPPDPATMMPFRFLHLSFAGALDDPAMPVAPTYHRLRPFPHGSEEDEEGPVPTRRGDRPLVYATLGTVYNSLSAIFASILAALRDEPLELIVTVGHNQDPAQFGPQPSHVRIERFVPQSRLLARCDLVIAHGGFGTVTAALAHGLPLVLIPISADQPENARRCAALGVGRVIAPDKRTPAAIRAAVRAVLGDPRYRRNAEHQCRELASLPVLDHGIALLERLAREQRPQVCVTAAA